MSTNLLRVGWVEVASNRPLRLGGDKALISASSASQSKAGALEAADAAGIGLDEGGDAAEDSGAEGDPSA